MSRISVGAKSGRSAGGMRTTANLLVSGGLPQQTPRSQTLVPVQSFDVVHIRKSLCLLVSSKQATENSPNNINSREGQYCVKFNGVSIIGRWGGYSVKSMNAVKKRHDLVLEVLGIALGPQQLDRYRLGILDLLTLLLGYGLLGLCPLSSYKLSLKGRR